MGLYHSKKWHHVIKIFKQLLPLCGCNMMICSSTKSRIWPGFEVFDMVFLKEFEKSGFWKKSATKNQAGYFFFCFCCHLLSFLFKITFFQKFFPELSECQTVWIQIRKNRHSDIPDLGPNLSVLIWVQTVCKGYEQTTSHCKQGKSSQLAKKDFNLNVMIWLHIESKIKIPMQTKTLMNQITVVLKSIRKASGN